jgi:hypothetical protein
MNADDKVKFDWEREKAEANRRCHSLPFLINAYEAVDPATAQLPGFEFLNEQDLQTLIAIKSFDRLRRIEAVLEDIARNTCL